MKREEIRQEYKDATGNNEIFDHNDDFHWRYVEWLESEKVDSMHELLLEKDNQIDSLIEKIIEIKDKYCPESAGYVRDYKYTKDNCHGEEVRCKECWRRAILGANK